MLVRAPLPVVSFLLAPGAFLLLAKVTIALASDSTAFVLIDSNLSVELPESLSPPPFTSHLQRVYLLSYRINISSRAIDLSCQVSPTLRFHKIFPFLFNRSVVKEFPEHEGMDFHSRDRLVYVFGASPADCLKMRARYDKGPREKPMKSQGRASEPAQAKMGTGRLEEQPEKGKAVEWHSANSDLYPARRNPTGDLLKRHDAVCCLEAFSPVPFDQDVSVVEDILSNGEFHFHWLSLAPDPKRETSLSNEIPDPQTDPRMPYRWNLQVLTSRSRYVTRWDKESESHSTKSSFDRDENSRKT